MENVIYLANANREAAPARFGLDTTFVLFFLAMDLGTGGPDMLSATMSVFTLAAFITLPYFLPFDGERPAFAGWAFGRGFIAFVGVLAGLALMAAAGSILPDAVRYLPLTLLIAAGIFCTGRWLYVMIKVRLAV